MKIRSLVIIVLLLAAASAAAYFLQGSTLSPKDPLVGKPLFTDLPVNDVTEVEIKSPSDTVKLQFLNDEWVVTSKSEYPADYNKVAALLRGFKTATIIRTSEGSPDELARLALQDPESGAKTAEKGSRVILHDQKGTLIANILIGSERNRPDKRVVNAGRFVKLPDQNKVYLVTGQLAVFDAHPQEWIERGLLDVRADDIKQISCYANDTNEKIFSFERPEQGQNFESTGPSVKYGHTELYLIATGLTSLALDDVFPADPEQTDQLESSFVFEFVTFNDMVYRVFPLQASPDSPTGQYTLRLDAACITVNGDAECMKRGYKLHDRFTPWIFKVNADSYNRFFPQPLGAEQTPDAANRENRQQ
jgi:hypothetical protein